MALVINHNLMASKAANNLSTTYNKLSSSVQKLSSGLRINSAADDAAGLAIREMMRADIATTQQGLRNAADAISMIQTADGALGVIDEKLVRMKELAEQASTGTYTTLQREIINSEYQAMANEIDRIANATNFNGIKLLDGSITNQHGGQGLKVHFGVSNKSSEDYYFVNIGDARATSSTGLRVGGDAKNDIWAQGGAAGVNGGANGCCVSGFDSLNEPAGFTSGQVFSYGYNWDWEEDTDAQLLSGKYTAGIYQVNSSDSLQDLVDKVNAGTQSRVGITFAAGTSGTGMLASAASAYAICLGDEAYYVGNADMAEQMTDNSKRLTKMSAGGVLGQQLVSAVNNNSNSQFVAMWDSAANTAYVFNKAGGDHNDIKACETAKIKASGATVAKYQSALNQVTFTNVGTGVSNQSGANFSLGGEHWAKMTPSLTKEINGTQVWNVKLEGRDVGVERDIWIANMGPGKGYDMSTDETIDDSSATGARNKLIGLNGASNVNGLDRNSFVELQNAANADWRGAEVRTQSSAQLALDAISEAITRKDKIRADLGAMQNRLENTMTNLTIQAENLQASESRISDVDVATEMTEFTKNNVMAQAATSMLAQANSMSQLALQLL